MPRKKKIDTINEKDKSCYVLEVQYGEECIEEDIERRD